MRRAQVGDYFIGKLRELQKQFDCISDVRGRGLMLGMRFMPPLLITTADVDEAVGLLTKSLEEALAA